MLVTMYGPDYSEKNGMITKLNEGFVHATKPKESFVYIAEPIKGFIDFYEILRKLS